MTLAEIKDFLDEKVLLYNQPAFIDNDPVSIPHLFTKKEDIEIAGFFAATIAWGQRLTILRNAAQLMHFMDNAPHDFILNFTEADLNPFSHFVHRTFNGTDCIYYLHALKNIYQSGGLSALFANSSDESILQGIVRCRQKFFELKHAARTEKHFSNPMDGSACKRINMFLRWMVRRDNGGIDFGIWNQITPAALICPLDVHSGRIARRFGLLTRNQNDWKAAVELTDVLKSFDSADPVKYDIALFSVGAIERL